MNSGNVYLFHKCYQKESQIQSGTTQVPQYTCQPVRSALANRRKDIQHHQPREVAEIVPCASNEAIRQIWGWA